MKKSILSKAIRRSVAPSRFQEHILHCSEKRYKKIKQYLSDEEIDKYNRLRFLNDLDSANLLNISHFRIIKSGGDGASMFNMCFLFNVLGIVVEALYDGFLPIVDIRNDEGVNIWEMLLEQPCGINCADLERLRKENPSVVIDETQMTHGAISPRYLTTPYLKEEKRIWQKVFSLFVKLHAQSFEYVQSECNELLSNRRVLGVLARGTDFTSLQPAGHPVQPSVDQLIKAVKQKMDKHCFDYIYLATEEKRIEDQFKQAFPNIILTNKRLYFADIYYSDQKVVTIGHVKFGIENERYQKSLQYFSSLVILSKCQALIAGNCGGSVASLLLSNGNYEYEHIFNLGTYSNAAWHTQKEK